MATHNAFFTPHPTNLLLILNLISFTLCLLSFIASQTIIILIHLGGKDQQNQLIKNLFKTTKVS